MTYIIPTVIIALVSLITHFFSPSSTGTIVLILYGLTSIFLFVMSFIKHYEFEKGFTSIKSSEVIAISSMPFATIIILLLVIVMFIYKINPLHLFYIAPILSFAFEYTIGNKSIEKLDKDTEVNKT